MIVRGVRLQPDGDSSWACEATASQFPFCGLSGLCVQPSSRIDGLSFRRQKTSRIGTAACFATPCVGQRSSPCRSSPSLCWPPLRMKLPCQKSMRWVSGIGPRQEVLSGFSRVARDVQRRTRGARGTHGTTRFFCVSRDFCVDYISEWRLSGRARSDPTPRGASGRRRICSASTFGGHTCSEC